MLHRSGRRSSSQNFAKRPWELHADFSCAPTFCVFSFQSGAAGLLVGKVSLKPCMLILDNGFETGELLYINIKKPNLKSLKI